MHVLVINGTGAKGVSFQMKEIFLEQVRRHGAHEVTEIFLPKESPPYCIGCKQCFFTGEQNCPHASAVDKIWQAMQAADLLLFVYPVYVMGAPAQIKALLDHLGHRYMVHRPDARLFTKRAALLTQSIGAPNGAAQKDVSTSLGWMGYPYIKKLGFGLMEGIIWDELSAQRREKMAGKIRRFADQCLSSPTAKTSLSVKAKFAISKMMRKRIMADEKTPSLDSRYWLEQAWVSGARLSDKP